MQITRIDEAKAYEAARHVDVSALRLQGMEASETENFWCGLSHYLPGGKAEWSAAPLERARLRISEDALEHVAQDGQQGDLAVFSVFEIARIGRHVVAV